LTQSIKMTRSQRGIGINDHYIHARHGEDLGDSAAHVSGADDGDLLHHSISPYRKINRTFRLTMASITSTWTQRCGVSNLDEVGTGILGMP